MESVPLARKCKRTAGAVKIDVAGLRIDQSRDSVVLCCLIFVGNLWRQEESVGGQRKPRCRKGQKEHNILISRGDIY